MYNYLQIQGFGLLKMGMHFELHFLWPGASKMEAKWQPKWTRMASNGSNMVSKRVFEKGMKKRSEKGHAEWCDPIPCGPLKEHPRMGGKGHPNSLRDTPLVPKGTVADI